jgi:hypothetical protein
MTPEQAQDYKDRYEHQYEMKCKAQDERDALAHALQWCSGSDDFAPGGKARKGWVKLCQPLLT